VQGRSFDAQLAAPHRLTTYRARVLYDPTRARKPEITLKVPFRWHAFRKAIQALCHLYHAFPAFSLLAAGGGNGNSEGFRALEQALARGYLGLLMVEMQLYAHARHSVLRISIIISWIA
jgi:hypothetical protein